MTLENFKKEIMNEELGLMSSVQRHGSINTIQTENIAEHSFYVAYYAMKIGKYCNLPEEKLWELATLGLIHELGESSTNDVASNVKYSTPGLKEKLDEAEDYAVKKYYPEVYPWYHSLDEKEKNKELEGIIVKLADIMALLSFFDTEKKLGNHTTRLLKAEEKSVKKAITYYELLKEKLKERE